MSSHRRLHVVVVLAAALFCVPHSTIAYRPATCLDILDSDPDAPSGVYHLTLESESESNDTIEVYCEMGLNGGGYTILSPMALSQINNELLQNMITNTTDVLFMPRSCISGPRYLILSQHPEYIDIPIKLALNDWSDYTEPQDVQTLGTPYLFCGFLPKNITTEANGELGITANGQVLNYTRQQNESAADSYIAFFPNNRELQPFGFNETTDETSTFCTELLDNTDPVPSGRELPVQFFMFFEMSFGGNVCHFQTTPEERDKSCVISGALGFR